MRSLFATILLSCIVLVACNSETGDKSTEIQSNGTSHQLTTYTPTLMRSIPVTALSLTVIINKIETRYQGTNSSDGTWPIEFELIPNQEYELAIKWYSSDFLILEEFGQFTTPATGTTITPVLDYRSAGRPEFDVDCDGFSNLEEVNNGTSLTIAEGLSTTACSDDGVPVVLNVTERAYLSRVHDPIEANETTPRFTSAKQTLQINTTTPTGNIAFITNLETTNYNPATDETNSIRGWLSFRQHSDSDVPRFMEFGLNVATAIVESDIADQFCRSLAPNPGFMCTVTYEWQEDRWYTISIEETTPTSWSAQVIDLETQVTQQIATFTTLENFVWEELSTGMIDYIDYPQSDCISGLLPSHMTYKSAIVNGVPTGTTRLRMSNCVKGGAGWSEGFRTVQDELEYKLTMGREQ